jgi:FkbM family methyltransferase
MILEPAKMLNAFGIIIEVENWEEYARWFFKMPPKDDFIKLRNGIKHRIRKHDDADRWVVNEVWIHKPYTPAGFEIKENDTVIDIGGHIGAFSMFAAMHAKKGKVLSFEPFPESYELLKENITLNRFTNIKMINLGVSSGRGTRRIYINKEGSCCNSMYVKKEKFVDIGCITLQDIFNDYNVERCNFLKIDCEGGEYDIIFSTPDDVFRKIDKIALEYHDKFIEKYNVGMLQEFLEKKGFRVTVKKPMLYAKR